jgi:hypothetical protein
MKDLFDRDRRHAVDINGALDDLIRELEELSNEKILAHEFGSAHCATATKRFDGAFNLFHYDTAVPLRGAHLALSGADFISIQLSNLAD